MTSATLHVQTEKMHVILVGLLQVVYYDCLCYKSNSDHPNEVRIVCVLPAVIMVSLEEQSGC